MHVPARKLRGQSRHDQCRICSPFHPSHLGLVSSLIVSSLICAYDELRVRCLVRASDTKGPDCHRRTTTDKACLAQYTI